MTDSDGTGPLTPLSRWAGSGIMQLSGAEDGAPFQGGADVYSAATDRLGTLRAALSLDTSDPMTDAATVLGGRAALLGLTRHGRTSARGGSRLLRGPDGWCCVTLARDDDVRSVGAIVGRRLGDDDPWAALSAAANRSSVALVKRAVLFGVPAAMLGETAAAPPTVTAIAAPAEPRRHPLVVDFSALWAGPLATQLLARSGAVVVKVESRDRPDAGRVGDTRFFDWLNAGKLSLGVDWTADHLLLRKLVDAADVVVEASRPRALTSHGLAVDQRPAEPGKVRVRITGHGATGDSAARVAFGDDAAVAGGLVAGSRTAPFFLGDAIADPLTGIETALAIARSLEAGGGSLIDLTLSGVAAGYARHLSDGVDSASTVEPRLVAAPTPPLETARASGIDADRAEIERLVSARMSAF